MSRRATRAPVRKLDAARPAQTRKVAANPAWFEFQPARVTKPGGTPVECFETPAVVDAPIERVDEHGLGLEPNNLAAINNLLIYRRLATSTKRWRCRIPTSHRI